jgi:hypothetical protein
MEPIACTTDFRFGLVVSVVDEQTRTPVAAGATVLIVDGAYRDSVVVPGDPSDESRQLALAGERPGIYTIVVNKPGYASWSRAGVEVTRDDCHVQPVAVTAELQKSP